ncbi:MAG TPA: type II secretion system F family protein [Afifellaceae bacterium]|nr:type II secretion system F family protein [Afifellaceae bacterium]
MAAFAYEAYTAEGRLVRGSIDAQSPSEALRLLKERGEFPCATPLPADRAIRSTGSALPTLSRGSRISLSDLSLFAREFATLLAAGAPIADALRLIASGNPRSAIGTLVTRLREEVISGKPLSEAMAASRMAVPPEIVGLVKAGEASGQLAAILQRVAEDLQRRHRLGAQLTSSLIYPSLLVVVALVSMSIILTVLIPNLTPLFDSPADMPTSLRMLVQIESFVAQWWAAIVGAILLAMLATGLAYRTEAGALALERIVRRMPAIGGIVSRTASARVARVLGLQLQAGVPLLNALAIARDATRLRTMRAAVDEAREGLIGGAPLSDVAPPSLFPPREAALLAIGEGSGKLDSMLLHVAMMYEDDVARRSERLASLVTPVLTILIGILVATIILSVMGAIAGVNELAL